ncbi:MAG: hypothetical protein IKP49_02080 [Treponema sp.]|nr:hypothetical protein [Treponema sp.]
MMKLYFSLKNAFSICTKPSSMSGGEYGAFWWGGTKPARTGLAQRFSCKERDMHGRKSQVVGNIEENMPERIFGIHFVSPAC